MSRDRRFLSLTCAVASLALFAATAPLSAHPGHGSIDSSLPLHYLADPEHATPWMVGITIAVLALAAFRWARKSAAPSATQR